MNNWHYEVIKFIEEHNYTLVSQWYEKALEENPNEITYYWYLGLSYLLDQKTEEAHSLWVSLLMEADILELDKLQQDLVNILLTEAIYQEQEKNYFLAWIIREYIQEIYSDSLENQLKIIELKQKHQQTLFNFHPIVLKTVIQPSILSIDLFKSIIISQQLDAIPDYYNRPNLHLLDAMNPNSSTILEIGCGAGALGETYKKLNPNCQYFGVELNQEAANIASQRLDKVIIGDVEKLELQELELVDSLIYGDVLEHLVSPEQVLKKHLSLLKEDGEVLACIPNIGHWTILAQLFLGKWQYEEEGLLDKTHLRFFTLDSIKELFKNCGLHIIEIKHRLLSPPNQQFLDACQSLLKILQKDAISFQLETSSFQYIVRAKKSPIHLDSLLIHTRVSQTICNKIRIYYPGQMMNTIPGVTTIYEEKDDFQPLEEFRGLKVFIWQRPFLDYPLDLEQAIAKQKALIQAGYSIILELDDAPLAWSPEIQQQFFVFLNTCHAVQTSTEILARELSNFHPNVRVFPNYLPFLPPLKQFINRDSISLFFGAQNREQDWQSIMPYLNQILTTYPDKITVKVIYDQLFFDTLETKNKTFYPWIEYYDYLKILSSCDIALLPLSNNPFNSMKSDLKFLESSACSVASLASPTVYGDSITEYETGLIYHSDSEFKDKLTELLFNTELRQQIATNAYHWVKNTRLLSQHYLSRYQWYRYICDNLLENNRELAQRCPELFDF